MFNKPVISHLSAMYLDEIEFIFSGKYSDQQQMLARISRDAITDKLMDHNGIKCNKINKYHKSYLFPTLT